MEHRPHQGPQVWEQTGVRGEGIVVANIDSAVDYTHPAVNHEYRGTRSVWPRSQVFDLLAEGAQVLPSLDIAPEAGSYTALTRSYTVTVTDGVLDVRFVTYAGFGKPLLNSLRVTDRPDRAA